MTDENKTKSEDAVADNSSEDVTLTELEEAQEDKPDECIITDSDASGQDGHDDEIGHPQDASQPATDVPEKADPQEARSEKLDKAMNGLGQKVKGILSTKNGKIGAAVVALAFVVTCLFTSHTICFHDWTDATCTEPQICRKCGRTQGDPLGHEWVEATCTEPKTCDRCGLTEGEPLGHSVDEWKTTKEATCTSKGEQQGECTRCGEIQSKTIKMKDHEFGDWKTTKAPTCTSTGKAERKCKNCDQTESKLLEKTEHTPGEWEIETPAKIDGMGGTVEGKRVQKCTVCGTVIKEESYTLSEEEAFNALAEECLTPSFDDVARDPESYRGINVIFKGEVIQVLQDGNDYTLRVNVTNTGYYWKDTIMVYYTAQSGDKRILEDDVITFYGPMHGMYSYQSVLGATITVPLMEAYYIRY